MSRGADRWRALVKEIADRNVPVRFDGIYRVLELSLDAHPADISGMTGRHNRGWNTVLLNQLQRASALEILESDLDLNRWTVRLLDPELLETSPDGNEHLEQVLESRELERNEILDNIRVLENVLTDHSRESGCVNQLAKTRSRDRVLQIRAYMRDMFAEAVDQGFLTKDPARKVKPPANLRATDKTVLTWDHLAAAVEKLDLRDRILLRLDITNALRPGELFAPRWKCHHVETLSLSIVETVYKGKIRPYGKTKGSLREVPISEDVSKDLVLWRKVSQERYDKRKKKRGLSPSDPEAFIFPGRFGGFMDSSNYRKRVLHKLAAELQLPKLTFQVIRRTTATLAQKKGTVKDVQGVMGHTRLATTTDVYMQPIPESVRATVDSLDRELQLTMKKLAGGSEVLPATAAPSTAMMP